MVLFELYDEKEPILNVLTAHVLQPDCVVYLGDERMNESDIQRPILNFFNKTGYHPNVKWIVCPPEAQYNLSLLVDLLEAQVKQYAANDVVFDVTGGEEILLLALGTLRTIEPDIGVIAHREGEGKLVWLDGPKTGSELEVNSKTSLQAMVALQGGSTEGHGHTLQDNNLLNDFDLLQGFYQIYCQYQTAWGQFVHYMQQINNEAYWSGPDGLSFRVPLTLSTPNKAVKTNTPALGLNTAILIQLKNIGLIESLSVSGGQCSFRVPDSNALRVMCDAGMWFEQYIYAAMKNTGLFDQVELSTIINWDDDNRVEGKVLNELDVIGQRGIGQVFISCKTGNFDMAALNEIAQVTRRFGSRYSVPVLATTRQLSRNFPALYYRAMAMGIDVIEADDLPWENLELQLQALARRLNV